MTTRDSEKKEHPNLSLLMADLNQVLYSNGLPKESAFEFILDGVTFSAHYAPEEEEGVRLLFWAELGYFPYSVESSLRRHLLTKIMFSARRLITADFGIDSQKKIILTGNFVLNDLSPPNYFFPQILAFWKEAKPFVRLIGDCL